MRSLLVAGTRLAYPGNMRILTLIAVLVGGVVLGLAPTRAAEFQTLEIASRNGVHPFMVEIATTEEERERGLMYRKSVPEGTGMLFDFDREREVIMWMKNTYVSLDMIFIRADGTIARIAENTTPLSEAHINSGPPVKGVLEVAAGTARKYGISVGDKISHRFFSGR